MAEAAFSEVFGNCVSIDRQNGFVTMYRHCSELYVQKGDTVLQGQKIAAAGQTGWTTGPHLHLSLLKDGVYVDPSAILG